MNAATNPQNRRGTESPTAIEVFAPGKAPPPRRARELQDLFLASYHRYPYMDEISAVDRVSLVATLEDRCVGYASFAVAGAYARCAHLLVAAEARGRGLGRLLDRERHRAAERRGLRPYVSCLCEDTASQKLKLELGLVPVNVKYGHQVESFVAASGVGTALVFSEGPFSPTAPGAPSIDVDEGLRRVSASYACANGRRLAAEFGGWYVEVLAGSAEALQLDADPEWAYAGLELENSCGAWHYCFQLRNDVYRRGVEERPALVADAAAIAELHPLPGRQR